jgi:hypothetical protein
MPGKLGLRVMVALLCGGGAAGPAHAQRCLDASVQWSAAAGIPPPSAQRRTTIERLGRPRTVESLRVLLRYRLVCSVWRIAISKYASSSPSE